MRVGFFYQETTPQSRIHLEIAKPMLASIRKVMPDVQVIQFTDATSEILEGVDGFIRIGGNLPMAIRRLTHHANCHGDWLFCDTDVIFQSDIRDVFDEEFDIALTDRVGTYMEKTEYAKFQPFNMGITFSRNPKFWELAIEKLKGFPSQYQQWEGDQMVVCGLADNQKTPFDIVILPGRIYNFTPKTEHEDVSHAAIVHYKGAKKSWIK